jgi:hypothetical protein
MLQCRITVIITATSSVMRNLRLAISLCRSFAVSATVVKLRIASHIRLNVQRRSFFGVPPVVYIKLLLTVRSNVFAEVGKGIVIAKWWRGVMVAVDYMDQQGLSRQGIYATRFWCRPSCSIFRCIICSSDTSINIVASIYGACFLS